MAFYIGVVIMEATMFYVAVSLSGFKSLLPVDWMKCLCSSFFSTFLSRHSVGFGYIWGVQNISAIKGAKAGM